MIEDKLYILPLWLIALLILLALAAAVAAGRLLNSRWRRRFGDDDGDKSVQSFILSASLGLLSLLMGFTFSMATDNFEDQRAAVIEDSNAIGSIFMLSQTFAEPHRSRLGRALTDYSGARLALGANRDPAARADLLRRSESVQASTWATALDAAAATSDNPVEAIFLNTTQQALNAGDARDATRAGHHIPSRVTAFLIVFMIATATLLGFQTTTLKPLVMGATLLVILTMSTVLILDLDRPTEGAIVESQRPMQRLHDRLVERTALQADRLAAPASAGRSR
jgi:hypothetical protein